MPKTRNYKCKMYTVGLVASSRQKKRLQRKKNSSRFQFKKNKYNGEDNRISENNTHRKKRTRLQQPQQSTSNERVSSAATGRRWEKKKHSLAAAAVQSRPAAQKTSRSSEAKPFFRLASKLLAGHRPLTKLRHSAGTSAPPVTTQPAHVLLMLLLL